MSVTWELGLLPLVGLHTGPQVGLQVFVSLRRYSAWTGLWLCRTLMASSTLNHFLFLPARTSKEGQVQVVSIWIRLIDREKVSVTLNDTSLILPSTRRLVSCYQTFKNIQIALPQYYATHSRINCSMLQH